MKKSSSVPVSPSGPTGLRALSLFLLLFAHAQTQAGVVCSPMTNLDVPATTEGVYLNLITGTSGTTEASVPGFDINIYAAASTNPSGQMKFYWGPESTGGAGVASIGDAYAVLGPNVTIGPGSTFTRAAFTGDTSAWQAGTTGFLGMRFRDEGSATIVYGWLALTTTAPLGFPAMIEGWCHEDSGAEIVTPDGRPDEIFSDGFDG
jgi:hypothetical protein